VRDDQTPDVVARLWDDFKQRQGIDARERLILHYSPLVKFVAGRVGSGLPQNLEQADLVSYGIFGLIDAIEKFDPARGFKFETYAIARIKGAIIDELRSIDWVPRSVRAKARAIERAEVDEMKHLLADAINRVPDRERLVLTLYYYEGLTLSEIGDVLGVTESRVCQIHTKAILQLRARFLEPQRQ
jgi:RNA polymerase sigma factor (sigma-70 family)